MNIFSILHKKYGNLNWWPVDKKYHEKNNSDPRFEIIVGAILTQNTGWNNVEKAIINLKLKNKLEIKKILEIDINKLKDIIKPSGFFNQKAERLKNISSFFYNEFSGNLNNFFNRELNIIREELLSLNGIGPETADSILLYAGNLPIFVVDAYTKRLCERIPLTNSQSYDDVQKYFEKELKKNYTNKDLVNTYNELHAQIVIFSKDYCKKKPKCFNCPLGKYCNYKKKSF